MAKRRDIIVAIVIGASILVVLGMFALMMVGLMSSTDTDVRFGGLGDAIGVIDLSGVISEESGRPIVEQLDKWRKKSSVRAIVLHVNSPGGEVAISQEIYDAILRVREDKPVVVSMAGVAASGGYYVACAADRIVANPGTLTGSIGVIVSFHTFDKLMDKWGISTATVKSGELKDAGSYSKPMSEKDELMLQSVVMDTYEQFVGVVAEGRGLQKEAVYPLADGSVFTGLQAYNLGLVDQLGGFKEAVDLAATLANMEGEPEIVRPYKRETLGWGSLLGGVLGKIPEQVESYTAGPKLLYLFQ
jgi:protease IV